MLGHQEAGSWWHRAEEGRTEVLLGGEQQAVSLVASTWFWKGGREAGGRRQAGGQEGSPSVTEEATPELESCLGYREVKNFGVRRACHLGIRTMEARQPGWSKDVSESDSTGLASQLDHYPAKGHGAG